MISAPWSIGVAYQFDHFDNKCFEILHVLDLSPSIMIRKSWGTGSVKGDVARKSYIFT